MSDFLTRSSVNNAGRDPLQGFDCDVYVLDQGSGKQLMVGRFTSFQLTVRNATEPYMEFNQRVPRMLDGEFQFGWVLERGLLDTRVLENTFGYSVISREQRVSRSPRFIITLDMNAQELDESSKDSLYNVADGADPIATGNLATSRDTRRAKGAYRLMYAKVDSWTLGSMAGRSVVASRWEGLCEGIQFIGESTLTPGLTLAGNDSTVGVYQNLDTLSKTAKATSTLPSWTFEGVSA